MKLDVLGFGLMIGAILIGNIVGPILGGFVGLGAGLFGAFITGGVIYLIWALLTGTKMSMMGGIIFSICVYAAVIVTGMVSAVLGAWAAILAIVIEAVFLSLSFSWIAPKGQAAKAPIKL